LAESIQSSFVQQQSIKGAMYNVAVSAITILLGFVRSVLLMRLVSPDAFGYVSLALFFMVFLTQFSAFGMDRALVQRRSPTKETFSTHFVLRTLLAVAVLVVGLLASPLLRLVYSDQVVVVDVLLILLLANVLVASFSTPGAILRRDLRFGALALLNLFSSVAMTVSAPLLAYWGAGLWSLVVEQVIGYVIRWIGFWVVLRPWRFSLRFDWGEARSLLQFGSHALLADVMGFLLDRFDDFWAGTALGATSLGHYSRAYEIAQYPERVLATPITSVFFPTYAALQDKKRELTQAFFRSSSFLVRAGFLMAVVLLVVIPEATLVLFGVAWLPIVPILRLMVVYVILDPLYINLSYLAIGMGRPEVLSRTRLLQLVLFVVTVPAFAYLWGVHGIAVAANLMISCGVLALLGFAYRRLHFSLLEMLGWPLVALAASFAAGVGLIYGVAWQRLWSALIVKGMGVAATYVVVLGVAERRTIGEYGGWILRALRSGRWFGGDRNVVA
jgi:PST family polysaccharide transporter